MCGVGPLAPPPQGEYIGAPQGTYRPGALLWIRSLEILFESLIRISYPSLLSESLIRVSQTRRGAVGGSVWAHLLADHAVPRQVVLPRPLQAAAVALFCMHTVCVLDGARIGGQL